MTVDFLFRPVSKYCMYNVYNFFKSDCIANINLSSSMNYESYI